MSKQATERPELKPCEHCGVVPQVERAQSGVVWVAIIRHKSTCFWAPWMTNSAQVITERAFDAWNTRSRHLEAAAQQAAWQPIESAPKDGTRILICSPDDVFVAEWDGNGWLYCATPQGQCGYVQSATGWQLAPLPPKDASGRET